MEVWFHVFLISAVDGVIGQLHAPADEMALEAGRTSLALHATLCLFSLQCTV
jgi:hypothetical protein